MNYLASCARCNRKRQARLIDDAGTTRGVLRAREAILHGFDDYRERAAATDPAFAEPFWTGVRCADHDWHIYGSPGYDDCRALVVDLWHTVPVPEEWWSRFGSRSQEVLDASVLALERHGLDPVDAWTVLAHLPRYASSADHAFQLVRGLSTPAAYRGLHPAPSYLLSLTVPLAATNAASSARRRNFSAAKELHSHLKEVGIDWFGLAQLWTRRRWPSSHLFYHRAAVVELAAGGKQANLDALSALETARAADLYLAGIAERASRHSKPSRVLPPRGAATSANTEDPVADHFDVEKP